MSEEDISITSSITDGSVSLEPVPDTTDFCGIGDSGSRGVNWFFTLHDPTPDDETRLKSSFAERCEFAVFQHEQCPSSGRIHLQGCIRLKQRTRFLEVKRVVFGTSRVNIQPVRHFNKAVEYCRKERTRVPGTLPWSFGDAPVTQGKRTDLMAIAEAVKSKRSIAEIASQFPAEFIKYHRGISALEGALVQHRDWKTEVFWLYGRTGTGKSTFAHKNAPTAYCKMSGNKWFDGYNGEADVIIDDFRPTSDFRFELMLQLCDRFRLMVEVKGGSRQFCAKRIFITCPENPVQLWKLVTDERLDQLLRRITECREFTVGGDENGRLVEPSEMQLWLQQLHEERAAKAEVYDGRWDHKRFG